MYFILLYDSSDCLEIFLVSMFVDLIFGDLRIGIGLRYLIYYQFRWCVTAESNYLV